MNLANNVCAICQDLISAETMRYLPCCHALHAQCYDELLRHAASESVIVCPTCRHPVDDEGDDLIYDIVTVEDSDSSEEDASPMPKGVEFMSFMTDEDADEDEYTSDSSWTPGCDDEDD